VNKWNNIFIQIAVADVRLTSFAATPESVFLRTTFVIATLTAIVERMKQIVVRVTLT